MDERSGKATIIGLVAIGLWAGLALSTVAAAGIPPFELLALSFAVAFGSGMVVLVMRGQAALSQLRQPVLPWISAFFAIFVYHALYYFALASVPPERASLIAYLWPLLIVVLSASVPGGERLLFRHLAGACLGFLGAAVIFLDRREGGSQVVNNLGYFAAAGCALIWSSYSVANRRFAHVPTEMLVGVCGAVAVAGACAHFTFESSVWPDVTQWLAVLFLGLGPVGLAFLAWDYATKHGNMPLLGALSYLAPLLSTLLLVMTGQVPPSFLLALSVVLIVGGAVIASYRRHVS